MSSYSSTYIVSPTHALREKCRTSHCAPDVPIRENLNVWRFEPEFKKYETFILPLPLSNRNRDREKVIGFETFLL